MNTTVSILLIISQFFTYAMICSLWMFIMNIYEQFDKLTKNPHFDTADAAAAESESESADDADAE